MLEILIRLVLAHIICDFYLQPKNWVEERNSKHARSPRLFFHSLLHGLISLLLLGDIRFWWLIPIITISHFLIDIWKSYQSIDLRSFIYDQGAHIILLVLVAFLARNQHPGFPFLADQNGITFVLIILLTLILLRPASFFIQFFMNRFPFDKSQLNTLSNAGKYIGYFERTIILACILTEAYAALGFLIASKSLLRFSDREKSSHQQTEYILVGSLLSWAISIISALLLKTWLSQL